MSAEARGGTAPLLDGAVEPAVTSVMLNELVRLASIRRAAAASIAPIATTRALRFGVLVAEEVWRRVPVRIVDEAGRDQAVEPGLLVNFKGEGLVLDGGSLADAIPLAGLTGFPVVSVGYRLAPEHSCG